MGAVPRILVGQPPKFIGGDIPTSGGSLPVSSIVSMNNPNHIPRAAPSVGRLDVFHAVSTCHRELDTEVTLSLYILRHSGGSFYTDIHDKLY